MAARVCRGFSEVAVTLLVFAALASASRQTIKDVLTIVQRIEEKMDKEDRFREITSIVHLDAAVDKVNKKLDSIISFLEGNGMAFPRIGGGSDAVMSDTPHDVSGRLDTVEEKLDKLEQMIRRVASSFEDADMRKIAAIERMVSQLHTDMNKKLQKMMNVVTALYEMNKEIKTNVGGRSSGVESQMSVDAGQFIIENLDELERKIKEQMSVMANEIRTEIVSLKIMAKGVSEGCGSDYDDFNDDPKQSDSNKRSSKRDAAKRDKDNAKADGHGGLDNSTVDTIIQSLGRTADEIRQEIHQGIRTIDDKLTNLTSNQHFCGDGDLQPSESVVSPVRESRDFEVVEAPEQSLNDKTKKKDKACTKTARNVSSPKSCDELRKGGATCDGVYVIFPKHTRAVRVYCDMTTDGGGWTVLMRRGDFGNKMTSFHKNWLSYKNGFGDVEGEFWLGNDVIHLLSTQDENVVLRVYLEAFDGDSTNLTYSAFSIENETSNYRMHIGPSLEAPTPASNSLRYHNNHPFSTYDRKNDPFEQNCAATYKGGWWFNGCYFGFLTGEYFRPDDKREGWQGMLWYDWKGNAALKGAQMMIRPARPKQAKN